MGKTLKILLFAVMLILLAMLFGIGYLATRIDAIFKPVKEYRLNITEREFEKRMDSLKKTDTSLKFIITGKRFNRKNRYYFTIIKFEDRAGKYVFDVNYNNNSDMPRKLNLQLMKAFDMTHHTGGQKPGKEVDHLTRIFERKIITAL